MSTFKPDQLARILRLSPGLDPESSMHEEINTEIDFELSDIGDGSYESTQAFWAEFAASYLPSLLRTFLSSNQDGALEVPAALLAVSCDTIMIGSGLSFGRFIRARPEEVLELYDVLKGAVFSFPLQKDNPLLTLDVAVDRISAFVSLLKTFATLLRLHLPSELRIPELTSAEREAAGQLGCWMRLDTTTPPRRSDASVILTILDQFSCTDFMLVDYLKFWVDYTKGHAWWRCEVEGKGPGHEGRVCVELKVGEEMQACSRCLCVRYCSKEHQKLDWRRHKRFCFEPGW